MPTGHSRDMEQSIYDVDASFIESLTYDPTTAGRGIPGVDDSMHNPFIDELTIEEIERHCEMDLGLGEPTEQEMKAMRDPLLLRAPPTDTFARCMLVDFIGIPFWLTLSWVDRQLNKHVSWQTLHYWLRRWNKMRYSAMFLPCLRVRTALARVEVELV